MARYFLTCGIGRFGAIVQYDSLFVFGNVFRDRTHIAEMVHPILWKARRIPLSVEIGKGRDESNLQ